MRNAITVLMASAVLIMLCTGASATVNYFQGFEVDTGGWDASQGITRPQPAVIYICHPAPAVIMRR